MFDASIASFADIGVEAAAGGICDDGTPEDDSSQSARISEALVNVQSVEAVGAELKRRAVGGN